MKKSDIITLGETLDEVEELLVNAINENWSNSEARNDKDLDVYLTRLKLVHDVRALYK